MSTLASEYDALLHDLGAVETERDLVVASGADSADFLQGQLSQDVLAIAVGSSAWSLLLQPQGKVDALVRVTRRGAADWLLDVQVGWGEQVIDRLNRFKLRTDCTLELSRVAAVMLRGPRAGTVDPNGATIAAAVDWGGLPGVDLVGEGATAPTTAVKCSVAALEVIRIEAGVAAMGTEIDESTIPAEANVVDGAVSFTKGCFTGQELVARIDSRGANTPRRLRGLLFEAGSSVPDLSAAVLDGSGGEVGRLTTVANSPGHGAPVALAYLRRAVEPGDTLTANGGAATVRDLPMFPD